MIVKACRLAFKDYIHETLLSACAILSLAAVLAPLLVLYGVKFGVISTMTERLKNDPRNLEIIPIASASYTLKDITRLQEEPSLANTIDFILPRTRSIAATMSLFPKGQDTLLHRITVSLEPTAQDDTLLKHYGMAMDAAQLYVPDAQAFAIVLSFEAARKLKAVTGTQLQGRIERLYEGKVERATVNLIVHAILPLEAQQKDVAFIPLMLLEATEDFRDGRKPGFYNKQQEQTQLLTNLLPSSLGWNGEEPSATATHIERAYAGFRLYAKNLDSVGTLRDYFAQKNIEVFTQAEQIAAVRSLDTSLTLIFTLIGGAAALGFFASTASNVLAAVRRKERHLGILRLMGYSSLDIMVFPIFQSLLTSILGSLLAVSLYAITASIIDHLFAHSLQGIEEICSLPPLHFFLAMGIVCLLSLLATLAPATRAAHIEPSEVIRDI